MMSPGERFRVDPAQGEFRVRRGHGLTRGETDVLRQVEGECFAIRRNLPGLGKIGSYLSEIAEIGRNQLAIDVGVDVLIKMVRLCWIKGDDVVDVPSHHDHIAWRSSIGAVGGEWGSGGGRSGGHERATCQHFSLFAGTGTIGLPWAGGKGCPPHSNLGQPSVSAITAVSAIWPTAVRLRRISAPISVSVPATARNTCRRVPPVSTLPTKPRNAVRYHDNWGRLGACGGWVPAPQGRRQSPKISDITEKWSGRLVGGRAVRRPTESPGDAHRSRPVLP